MLKETNAANCCPRISLDGEKNTIFFWVTYLLAKMPNLDLPHTKQKS
jgi:hypothetical protein